MLRNPVQLPKAKETYKICKKNNTNISTGLNNIDVTQ